MGFNHKYSLKEIKLLEKYASNEYLWGNYQGPPPPVAYEYKGEVYYKPQSSRSYKESDLNDYVKNKLVIWMTAGITVEDFFKND